MVHRSHQCLENSLNGTVLLQIPRSFFIDMYISKVFFSAVLTAPEALSSRIIWKQSRCTLTFLFQHLYRTTASSAIFKKCVSKRLTHSTQMVTLSLLHIQQLLSPLQLLVPFLVSSWLLCGIPSSIVSARIGAPCITMSTHFFIAATAALRISSSGEIGFVSKVNVVQTQSIQLLLIQLLPAPLKCIWLKVTTSNLFFCFSMIRDLFFKIFCPDKLSTPNLNFITTPPISTELSDIP